MATIVLAADLFDELDILLVDEFQRMNGVVEEEIQRGVEKTTKAIEILSKVYDLNVKVLLSSDIMSSPQYANKLQDIKYIVAKAGMTKDVNATVPMRFRHLEKALEYPLHEIACTSIMSKQGFEVKLGPSSEKKYDRLISRVGIDISFSYLIDAYAVGSEKERKVVHYSLTDNRIFLDDAPEQVRSNFIGSPATLKYFNRVGQTAGSILNKPLSEKESLEKRTIEDIIQNVLVPYQEASR